MRLTDEQAEAVDAFCSGGDLKLVAFAGTGKTASLAAMADEARGSALYLAYNRAIAAEARGRFPQGTRCSTMHGLAFQAMKNDFDAAKLTGALTAADIVEILELADHPCGPRLLTARTQAGLVRATLERFLHGTGEEPRPTDVPPAGTLVLLPPADGLELIGRTTEQARLLWRQMVDPCNPVPLGHDGYLKLWALGHPRIEAEHIFLDEAQDTNPVVLALLRAQAAQLVAVGDPHQRIYGWRGAIDVMTSLPARSAALTRSFRFGDAIAEAASGIVAALGDGRRLRGDASVSSRIGSCAPDAVIARTNAGVVEAVLDAIGRAERPHIVGGAGELMRLLADVERLKDGRGAASPELVGFARWSDVVETAAREPGAGLGTLVGLVEEHGADRLLAALARTARDEAQADLVVTTAHRAKGREWNRVSLHDDFRRAAGLAEGGAGRFDPAEARLFYVALTRARLAIDVPEDVLDLFGAPLTDAA